MSFDFSQLNWNGNDLNRPECVLATQAGYLYVSDFRGGVTEISPNGEQAFFGGNPVEGVGLLKPNGIALLENGDFLIAHLGDERGGIFTVTRDGACSPLITDINDKPLPPSNFIYLDRQGRLWLTVSTRICPRAEAYRPGISDGFIAIIENGKARVVADNLGYTNEVYVDPEGDYLYVNATFSRELIRYRIGGDNELLDQKVVTRFGAGTFPDGLTKDEDGNFWVTSIVSNRVIRVRPDGEQEIIMEDNDSDHLKWVEAAFQDGTMGRPHLDNIKSHSLKSISSLAFSGEDLSILNMGCLLDRKIPAIASDVLIEGGVSGIAPAHWTFDNSRVK